MSYIESTLGSGERVVEIFKLHWLPWLAAWIWVPVFGLGLLFLLSLKCTEQGVTNRRVVVKRGIIGRNTQEVLAPKVEHINISQGIFGRILGYGDVIVRGTGGGITRIRSVANPLKVKTSIENALLQG